MVEDNDLGGLREGRARHLHLTLPAAWRRRRFRVPRGVVLHHADITAEDRAWVGALPVTSPRRSLNDAARDGISPELLKQAAQQAIRRGLVVGGDLTDAENALAPLGGFAA